MAQQYRYPGAKPFQTDESHVFFGRAAVSEELYQLITLEPLVVLHAKSGLGKSSLINAGLLPRIEKAEEYQAFTIRFHAYTEVRKETPLGISRAIVQNQSDFLNKIRPVGDDSLWYHLKSSQIANPMNKGILLVFDQFEELFTYKDKENAIEDFARQLSEALYSTLPQRYRDKRKAGFEKNKNFLSNEELALLDQPLHLRILMAIRSDRMSLMKKLKPYFPTILSADFELTPLNREQAEDAILSPAYQKEDFITPIFDYEDGAIEYLLDFLSKKNTEPIESFQLQILCEYVEQHIVEGQNRQVIKQQDLANPDQILENYYLDKINAIPDAVDQLAARRLIEEGFIFEEEERRLTLYEGQILKNYGVNTQLLHQLLDTHLIRSEPSLRGGYTYELSHDTLVAPVLKAKAKRKEAERLVREKAEQQKREAELQVLREKEEAARIRATKEKQLRTIAEQNEKRAKQRTRLSIIVSILALLLSGLAIWFWNDAVNVKLEQYNTLMKLNETLGNLEKEKIATLAAKDTAELRRIEAEALATIAQDNAEKALDAKAETAEALKGAETQKVLAEERKAIADSLRNEALSAKAIADSLRIEAVLAKAKADAAKNAAQNASLALTTQKSNPTLALRIADYNLKKHPNNPDAITAFREVISNSRNKYYKIDFQEHSQSVEAVAFSPDGKSILTGENAGTVKLWDLKGNELQAFDGHDSGVCSVAFSPDRKRILSGSYDKTAKLWDIAGKELRTFQGYPMGYVFAVTLSPDGKSILTGSAESVKLWDFAGKELTTFQEHSGYVYSVAFSPDGKSILTGGYHDAKLWDIAGKELLTFQGHSGYVYSVAFSPDGKSILTGSEDNTAKLWDLKGNELRTFQGHSGYVYSVAFSPDGKSILTGSWDNTIKLWDTVGNIMYTFKGHSDGVYSVAISPNGKSILSGSWDSTAKLWDIEGIELQTFQGHSDDVEAVAFSPDGKLLTGGKDNTVKLWDTLGNELQTFKGHSDEVYTVAFSPNKNNILTGGRDKTARLWDIAGKELLTFQGHSEAVESVAFSPDGNSILTGSRDKTAKLWDIAGNELLTFQGHSSSVYAVAFSPDGKSILTGSLDNTAKLWDLAGNEMQAFQEHSSSVEAVAFSPDGNSILTGSKDNTAKLWDLKGNKLQTFRGHSSSVYSVAFSPDGNCILTGSLDNTAKLWDMKGNELITFQGHSSSVYAVAFSPDGNSILTGSLDNTAKLWLMPQPFLEQKVHEFTLQELYDAGTQLTEEDLQKVKQTEK